jgi:hypothetical protein
MTNTNNDFKYGSLIKKTKSILVMALDGTIVKLVFSDGI